MNNLLLLPTSRLSLKTSFFIIIIPLFLLSCVMLCPVCRLSRFLPKKKKTNFRKHSTSTSTSPFRTPTPQHTHTPNAHLLTPTRTHNDALTETQKFGLVNHHYHVLARVPVFKTNQKVHPPPRRKEQKPPVSGFTIIQGLGEGDLHYSIYTSLSFSFSCPSSAFFFFYTLFVLFCSASSKL